MWGVPHFSAKTLLNGSPEGQRAGSAEREGRADQLLHMQEPQATVKRGDEVLLWIEYFNEAFILLQVLAGTINIFGGIWKMTTRLCKYLKMRLKDTYRIWSNFYPVMGKDESHVIQVKVTVKEEVKVCFVVFYELSVT